MKNKFLSVILALLFSIGFATAGNVTDKHWTNSLPPLQAASGTMTSVIAIQIDGVEQANSNLEIGVFIDGICAGSQLEVTQSGNRYLYYLTSYGYESDEEENRYEFKLFDHGTNQEVAAVTPATWYFIEQGGFGSTKTPMILNFITGETRWELVTDATSLVEGDNVIIVGSETDLAMNEEQVNTSKNKYRDVYEISRSGNFITWDEPGEEELGPQVVTIQKFDDSDFAGLFVGSGYLYACSSSKDQVNTQDEPSVNARFSMTNGDDNTISLIAQGTYSRNRLMLGDEIFVCCAGNLEPVQMYRCVKYEAPSNVTLTLTANPAEGGTVTGGDEYEVGANVTIAAEANNGYEFVNWTKDSEVLSTNPTYSFEITESCEIVGNFAKLAVANPTFTPVAGTYTTEQNITIACATEDATIYYTIDGTDPTTSSTVYTAPFALSTTTTVKAIAVKEGWDNSEIVSATYTFTYYTITVNCNPEVGGSVEGAGSFLAGSNVTLTATPAAGYVFENWSESGTLLGTSTTLQIEATGNRTIIANFSVVKYQLSILYLDNEDNEMYHTYTTQLPEGAEYNVESPVITGYTADKLVVEGTMPGEDHQEIVRYTINSYLISATVDPEGAGTIEGTGNHNYNEEITLAVSAADGYTFVNWTENDVEVSTDPEYVFTVTANRTLVAHFLKDPFTITATAEPEIGGEVTGAGLYQDGQTVNLVAAANEGYDFVNWTENGAEVATTATYTFTANANRELVAHFVIKSFEITVTANPAIGGEVTGADTYTYGAEATINAIAAEGYKFVNWTEDGTEVSTNPEYTFEVTGAHAFIANFEVESYTLTIHYVYADDMMAFVDYTHDYAYGETYEVASPEKTGYTAEPAVIEGTMPAEDVEETVVYTAINYEIAATADPAVGGTITGDGTYAYDSEVTLVAEAAEGYTFINWTEDDAVVSTIAEYTFTVEGARSLVAHFILNPYTITATADPEMGGEISGDGLYEAGQEVTLVATANEGYDFINWTENGAEVANTATYTFTANADRELVAHFVVKSFEITVTANPAIGGEVTGGDTYTYGEEVTVNAIAAEGYEFVNWSENGVVVSTNPEYTFEVTGAHAFIANFALESYTLTIHYVYADETLAFEDFTEEYTFGQAYEVTSPELTGYTAAPAVVEGTMPAEDVEATVVYTANDYTITVIADPEIGGTVDGGDTYAYNTEATVSATAAEGYEFVNWTENDVEVSTDAEYTFTVTGNRNLIGHFAMVDYRLTIHYVYDDNTFAYEDDVEMLHFGDAYSVESPELTGYTPSQAVVSGTMPAEDVTVTVTYTAIEYLIAAEANPVEGGEITGAHEYAYNTQATLTAIANPGYTFVNWTEGDAIVSTEATYEFTVVAARELVANFQMNTYEITVDVNPANSGVVTGEGTYNYGETATMTATANAGYIFQYWTEAGEVVSNEATFEVVVEGSHNYVAYFEPSIVTLTLSANPASAGTVTGAGTFNYGENVTVTAEANEGFEFVNWTNNGEEVSTEATYTFEITGNTILVANFEGTLYDITVETVANGIINAPANAYYHDVINVSTTPYPNYHLSSLYYYTTDPNATVEIDLLTRQFVMPAADVTIGAVFALNSDEGDVNDDGDVNIIDVLTTINYILGRDPQPFNFDHADMNKDGVIDIADVMAINALILGVKGDCDNDYANYDVINDVLYISTSANLSGYQFCLSAEPTALDMPGFTAVGDWVNGNYIFLLYNLSNEKEAGVYSVLKLNGGIVYQVDLATATGCSIRGEYAPLGVEVFDEAAYSVYPVPARYDVTVAGPSISSIEVYNAMGQRVMTLENVNSDEYRVDVSSLTSGSYIFRINASNGTAVKNVIVVR